MGHLVHPPCPSRVTQSRLHSTLSRRGWNISREGDSTTSLGSLGQGSVTLRRKKFFLIFSWNLPQCTGLESAGAVPGGCLRGRWELQEPQCPRSAAEGAGNSACCWLNNAAFVTGLRTRSGGCCAALQHLRARREPRADGTAALRGEAMAHSQYGFC